MCKKTVCVECKRKTLLNPTYTVWVCHDPNCISYSDPIEASVQRLGAIIREIKSLGKQLIVEANKMEDKS